MSPGLEENPWRLHFVRNMSGANSMIQELFHSNVRSPYDNLSPDSRTRYFRSYNSKESGNSQSMIFNRKKIIRPLIWSNLFQINRFLNFDFLKSCKLFHFYFWIVPKPYMYVYVITLLINNLFLHLHTKFDNSKNMKEWKIIQ